MHGSACSSRWPADLARPDDAVRPRERRACASIRRKATAPRPPVCCRCGAFFTGPTACRRRAASCRSNRSRQPTAGATIRRIAITTGFVHLPHDARHEELWRQDEVYDVIAVLGWNDQPVVKAAWVGDLSAPSRGRIMRRPRVAWRWLYPTCPRILAEGVTALRVLVTWTCRTINAAPGRGGAPRIAKLACLQANSELHEQKSMSLARVLPASRRPSRRPERAAR